MITRRELLATAAAAFASPASSTPPLLEQFRYNDVQFEPGPLAAQLTRTHEVLVGLEDDDLLRPFRVRENLPAPGRDLGGWYDAHGFAPASTFGQWLSALARYYAATGDQPTREKINRLVRGYASTVEPAGRFYLENRFPAYFYDKIVCGLIDAHTLAGDPLALATLRRSTDAALPFLPPHAVARRETPVLHHEDLTEHCWDESYTLPENLFLAWQRTADPRYRDLAPRFLLDRDYFDPLSRNENVLPGRHAYSHVNALSSAAMAYLVLGDPKYLSAAKNGFSMVQQQSFATGGWGPDEHFVPPGSGKLAESLSATHASFETPCGSYGHFKIARYLLRITRDSRYGDSMERVLYNTVLVAKPLQPDGHAFYYSDYNFHAAKVYHRDKWPCCSGTLPQIAADYRISAYFHDRDNLYINLYVPSSVKWNGRAIEVTTDYPAAGSVRIKLTNSVRATYSIFLRIPAWASGAQASISGALGSVSLSPGSFAEVRREWETGDRIELHLPRPRRLEPIDAQHPNTVALLEGPLVLMALNPPPERLARADLLAARPPLVLKPFTQIADEPYTTYLQVSD